MTGETNGRTLRTTRRTLRTTAGRATAQGAGAAAAWKKPHQVALARPTNGQPASGQDDVSGEAAAATGPAATGAAAVLPNSQTGRLAALAPVAVRPVAVRPVAVRPVAVRLAAGAALPAPLATQPLAAAAEKPLPVAAAQPRFYVGLVGAPDVSTVKFASVERPLLNAGVTLEYRLTNRLRLGTGLLRADKEYYARREDYDWTSFPRAATRDFREVEGQCTVLDVPLNLRYDALVRPGARWFGSAGLSSFFMHRERYVYDYLDGGAYAEWDRSFVNENRHLLSILNLSLGYERSLGAHWRLQAEPYLKLPLGGVGAGKVRLTSAGVFVGVKYGF